MQTELTAYEKFPEPREVEELKVSFITHTIYGSIITDNFLLLLIILLDYHKKILLLQILLLLLIMLLSLLLLPSDATFISFTSANYYTLVRKVDNSV